MFNIHISFLQANPHLDPVDNFNNLCTLLSLLKSLNMINKFVLSINPNIFGSGPFALPIQTEQLKAKEMELEISSNGFENDNSQLLPMLLQPFFNWLNLNVSGSFKILNRNIHNEITLTGISLYNVERIKSSILEVLSKGHPNLRSLTISGFKMKFLASDFLRLILNSPVMYLRLSKNDYRGYDELAAGLRKTGRFLFRGPLDGSYFCSAVEYSSHESYRIVHY
jgi:hypothetical protein